MFELQRDQDGFERAQQANRGNENGWQPYGQLQPVRRTENGLHPKGHADNNEADNKNHKNSRTITAING